MNSEKNLLKSLTMLALLVLFMTGNALAADHSHIAGPFGSGPDVTKSCLGCHADAASDIMLTSHWTWSAEQVIDGTSVNRGKTNTINNFCISINGNWPRCTSCHIGYGWKDQSFDFNDKSKVDCLVCHDTTGSYKKVATGAGLPDESVDLVYIARNVGKTSRTSCGTCHFFGGGGDAVKHGDLDSSIDYPSRKIDVHMDAEGNNFACTACHATSSHKIAGNAMVVSPAHQTPIGCSDCHQETVHDEPLLNRHSDTVACQTCHIPAFAKEVPTKTSWDWSTAGQDIKGEKDKYGKPTYMKKKGHFTWDKNIAPTYAWYNGSAGAYLAGDKIDPTGVTRLSYPLGDRSDRKSKIYPFKVHTGKQIYDTRNRYLITPKVFGTGGYWKTFDWDQAAAAGMRASGLDYSGSYDFAPTEMYWRINHMVSPKEDALGCLDCHGNHGRMNWTQLGYKGDPLESREFARTR